MTDDVQFLEYIVKALVNHPEDVKITRTLDEMGVLMTLDVNRDDMGKIIGRAGNTAKAIRILLRVVGMKNNARINLKINEPNPTFGRRASDHSAGDRANDASSKNLDDVLDDITLD